MTSICLNYIYIITAGTGKPLLSLSLSPPERDEREGGKINISGERERERERK